ncbi:C-type lectin domain family 7 member A-like [Penaeus chinensis]|uniref:C-type lectin domain family 7 member A-like n=1 Tax=Penaeus chinensis TaxID=139456 RepID=UPI001FB64877|nr:C-type lectin domain family 7 member A-like [Penaeus chinensis]
MALPGEKALGEKALDKKALGEKTNTEYNCTTPYVPIAGRCLFFESLTKGTWGNMQTICQLLGGDLAKLDNSDVIGEVAVYITEHVIPEASYWIGASDEAKEGEWLWSDGSQVRMGVPLWYHCGSTIEPNGGVKQNCAAISSNRFYYITDEDCSGEYYGICEYYWT